MTRTRRDYSNQTPFEAWVRNQPRLDSIEQRLSVTDTDYWFHNFSRRIGKQSSPNDLIDNIMLVEVKTYMASPDFAQDDTLSVVDFVLRKGFMRNGRRYHMRMPDQRVPGKTRTLRCFGKHLLTLSNTRPDNSQQIFWDKTPVHAGQLVELLSFKLDPDSPSRELDTRRHHRRPAYQWTLPLFPELP